MDALLTNRWLNGATATPIHDEASVTVVREEARRAAMARGFGDAEATAISIVIGELAHNHLRHARDGKIAVREIARGDVPGVEIIAVDRGEGVARPTEAIEGATPSARGGLGIGLSGAVRMSDEIDFDVRMGAGTCIRARKFARRTPRRREVALLSRPCAGERVDGDDAFVSRSENGLFLTIADGLGHGPEAREASSRAVEIAAAADATMDRRALMEQIDEGLAHTRGTVMALVDLDETLGVLRHVTVGNITTHVASRVRSRTFTGGAMVLGARRATKRLHLVHEETPLAPGEIVVVASDGLRSTTRIDPADLHRHPLIIADRVMRGFAREGDDATVIVVG